MQIIFFSGVSPGLTILLPRSVLSADIQDPNSNAIATQYCNSNLSREMRSNMFQPLAVPGRRIYLLKVLTSGLLFSGEQTAEYSLSSCIQHTQRRNSFRARRGQRGIVQL